MSTAKGERAYHGVGIGTLTLHFDSLVAARRFRRVLSLAKTEDWLLDEATVLRLRDVSNASEGLPALEILQRFAGI
jgi:hypothetical protein